MKALSYCNPNARGKTTSNNNNNCNGSNDSIADDNNNVYTYTDYNNKHYNNS